MKRKYDKARFKLIKESLIKVLGIIILIVLSFMLKKIPTLIPIILILLLIFFIIEFIITYNYYKQIHDYLSGNKTFRFKPLTITQEELIDLIKEGLPVNTYISYNKQLHTIESKDNKYFFLDYNEYHTLEDLLNVRLSNIRISDIAEFELVAYNGKSPRSILKK